MSPVTPAALEAAPQRRVPVQERSRMRVERLLEAAGEVVVEVGVDALSTRAIASRAEIPVASLYQYFADKEALLVALVERDMAEMDDTIASNLAAAPPTSLAGVIESAMRSFIDVYRRRPAFVEVYLRGRTNAAVRDAGRLHNRRIARQLRDFCESLDLIQRSTPQAAAELAVEIGDRAYQLAFEESREGDAFLIAEAIRLVVGYLAPYAVDHGVPTAD